MNILLTGYSGQLGKELYCQLLWQNDITTVGRVAYLDDVICDLLDGTRLNHYLKDRNFDLVIHCAGVQNSDPECFLKNTLMTRNLINAVGPDCLFVFISSLGVYGSEWKKNELAGRNEYAKSKIACEKLISDRKRWMIFRPAGIISQNARHGLVHDVYAKLHSDSLTLNLFGDEPGMSKPYILARDAAKYITNTIYDELAEQQDEIGVIENVCGDTSMTVKEVAELIMDCTNIRKTIHWLGKSSFQPFSIPSSEKAIVQYCSEMRRK